MEWEKMGLTALFGGDSFDPVFSLTLMICLPRKRQKEDWDRTCFLGRWDRPRRHLLHPDLAVMAEILGDNIG